MAHVEIDDVTDEYLEFAARIAGISKGRVIAQLVNLSKATASTTGSEPDGVEIYADYAGHRTAARFIPGPGRIEITDGPLAGTEYKTPSEAARAVVGKYKPGVSPHRNGWSFWILSNSEVPLQTIRHRNR